MKLDLCVEEVFARPVDAVWRAITDRRLLARWLMDNDFEPRVGHAFTLREAPTGKWRGWIECCVLELDAPRRMVWSWDGGQEGETPSRLVFELREEGEGTRLTLRHQGDAPEVMGEALRSGWSRKLGVLGRVLGPDFACRVSFGSPREKVYEALTTLDGLRAWWTTLVRGSTERGADIRFDFEGLDEHIVMRVEEAKRPTRVRWTCLHHTQLGDWAGTSPTFDLTARGDGCELCFQHVGLSPKLDCYEMCEEGWEHFLASLVSYVDRAAGSPFGSNRARDQRVSEQQSTKSTRRR
jgi:uncharacterized protein YndB with AHSA1/START domain